jgi:putative restriction endonuclease
MPRTYGEIPGFPIGSTFENRTTLASTPVHRPRMDGICGGKDGTESIVVSGGYVDDEDYGQEIIYTGHGGNDPATKRQIADQQLVKGNAGLARSQLDGNPVRVIRGAGGDPTFSPTTGFRYDGLFRVVDHWHKIGKDGYRVWQFRLVTLESADPPPDPVPEGEGPVGRTEATIQRQIRNTAVANHVKDLHSYKCQICETCLVTPAGPYAEGAHIRGLGRPHNGPDIAGNVLCLCPNHHVLFDAGAIFVDAMRIVRSTGTQDPLGPLRTVPKHVVDDGQLAYHRDYHA